MTIEIPTPSAELISQLETATIETSQSETAAIAAIRERFTPYAKHNGFIQIAEYSMVTSNYRRDREAYLEQDGKKLRALLACDCYTTNHSDQNRGANLGSHLYLTELGEWIEVTRTGRWSNWQGESYYWYSSVDSAANVELEADDEAPGDVKSLTDEEVASEYNLGDILKQIGESMAEMSKKLPARYAKLQARAELAQRLIAAAKEGK